jgi:hypothetical protein
MVWRKIAVRDNERALVVKNGRFGGLLSPGSYALYSPPGVSLEIEKHNIRDLEFRSDWADYLIKERPDFAARHFTRIQTNDVQIALVYADGRLYRVLPPAKRVLFWRGLAEVTAEVVDVIDRPEIPAERRRALWRFGRASPFTHRRRAEVNPRAATALLHPACSMSRLRRFVR